MNLESNPKIAGLVLLVVGIGIMLFGGTTSDGGSSFTIMGIEFGHEQRRKMTPGESRFWGGALALGGLALLVFA